jgi:hypothetical protein
MNKSNDYPFNQIKYGHEIDYVAVYCEPIPLTEEWLLKFGFEKKYDTFEFNGLNVDGCVVHFSFDKWASEYEIENCDYTEVPSDIQHVHQLQNLYFALTGEELTIKQQ